MEISGKGKLTATGGKHFAGIGCSGDSSTLTIMWQTQVKSISIDDSTVTATGGDGGVKQAFKDQNFHINGGTVTVQRISTDPGVGISGGSVRCRLSGVKDGNGTKVYQTTATLKNEANTKIYSLETSKENYGTTDIFSEGWDLQRKAHPLKSEKWSNPFLRVQQ